MPALRSTFLAGFVFASPLLAHGGSYVPPLPPPVPPGGHYGGPSDTTGPPGPRTGGPSGPSAGGPSGPSAGGPSGPSGGPSQPSNGGAGPSTGGPSGPSAPGPSGPSGPSGPRGPTTGGRGMPIEHDFDTWDYWWEFNKNRFLLLRDFEARSVQTGSDDYYLGATRTRVPGTLRPTPLQTTQVVLPALKRAIDASANRDIATACMMAMAKIGNDHPEFDLIDVFVPRLRIGDQEVRETAALALGVMARDDTRSLPLLEDLALDSAGGRAAYGGPVDGRTRAFATWGLGLCANGAVDIAVKQRVFGVLRRLGDDDRNVRVAAIHGIGLLAPNVRSYQGAKLRADADAVLGSWFGRDLGAGDEIVQAHCPTAIGKLIVRGDAAAERWCDRFASELAVERNVHRRGNAIAQSCALALGQLVAPEAVGAGCEHGAALLEASRSHPDALTRSFALVALAQIGGPANRNALVKAFDGSKAMRKPWCALALGLLVHGERERQASTQQVVAPDDLVVSMLHDALRDAKEPGLVGALGVALGLCGAAEAAPLLRERLLDGIAKEQMAGYLCIGLALMQDQGAVEDIRRILATATRRPELLVQASVALGRLGDREGTTIMLERMTGSQANLTQLAAFATGLSQVGDHRSIDPLIRLLQDTSAGALPRAFAAAALGGICDWRSLPWSTPIGANINYRAAVETLTDQHTGILDIL